MANGSFVRVKRETDQVAQFYIRIVWNDNTEADKVGSSTGETVKLFSITPPAQNDEAEYSWEMDSGAGFVSLGAGVTPKDVNFPASGVYEIRYKSVVYGMTYYSNVLRYTRQGSNIFITNVVQTTDGNTTYKLHVENQNFVGFAITRTDVYSNSKITTQNSTHGTQISIINPPGYPASLQKSEAITLGVGVYDCEIALSMVIDNMDEEAEAQGLVAYSPSTNLADQLANATVLILIQP